MDEFNTYGEFNQKDGAPFKNDIFEKSEFHLNIEPNQNNIEIDNDSVLIPKYIYSKLCELGIIFNDTRNYNVGESDYSKHFIQPWSIWIDYNLNAFDADIIKRILRVKKVKGKSEIKSRIEDYQKIKHICDERIRQLSCISGD